jgi:RecA/RadA recombinase
MAKQVKSYQGKKANFSDLNNYISQFDSEGALLEDYSEIETFDWIHSGNYLFNAQISGSLLKGYPINRITTIAGDPKTGKSFLAFNAVESLQKMGYFVWIFETEHSPDKDRFKNQNIDPKMVRFTQPETSKDIIIPLAQVSEGMRKTKREFIEKNKDATPDEIRDALPKLAVVIDSISGLNSSKQVRDAVEESKVVTDMGTIAREIKLLFNMMTVRLGKLGIPVICTAHVYEKDMGNFKEKTVSGGLGSVFLSSIVAALTKRPERVDSYDADGKKTKIKTGIFVKSHVVESRYSTGEKDIELYISTRTGMQPYLGLHHFVNWELCGIDKGKFVDYIDLAGELLSKKMATKSDFVSGKKFKIKDLYDLISKAKQESFEQNLKEDIEDGILEVVGGVAEYNPKKIQKFKFLKTILGHDEYDSSDIISILLSNGSSKEDILTKGFSTEFVLSIIQQNIKDKEVIYKIFEQHIDNDIIYMMGNAKLDLNRDQSFKFKKKGVEKSLKGDKYVPIFKKLKVPQIVPLIEKMKILKMIDDITDESIKDTTYTTDVVLSANMVAEFQQYTMDGIVTIIDVPNIDIKSNQEVVFLSPIMDKFDGDVYNKTEKKIGLPKSTSPDWIVKHLGRSVKEKELWSKHVFTIDVLKKLDTVVRPIYEYSELKEATMSELSDDMAMDDVDMNEGLAQILDMAESAAAGIKASEKTIDDKK